ncbi:VCBS repeat-containing protein [Candidatus Regiella endosymbiont of Tuberolachnus salignus]|uniref:FG-GAP repeat domain-containing protein n=1 Tax=Candidatus Regiella endosymbiont of Tuberolachnus salignus TaxID=3077956 RepID=UPI0030D5BD50
MKKALASFLGIKVKKDKNGLVAESSTESGYSNSLVEAIPEAGSSSMVMVDENRAKFVAIFTDILLDPQQLGSNAEILTSLLPDYPQIKEVAKLLFTEKQETVEHLRTQLNGIISSFIVPRINEEHLQELIRQVSVEGEFDEAAIRSQSAEVIRSAFKTWLNRSPLPLQIVRKESTWHINRCLTQQDIGSLVVLPIRSGKTLLARVVFENEQFRLKLSGVNQEEYLTTATLQPPLLTTPYPIEMIKNGQKEPISRVGHTLDLALATDVTAFSITAKVIEMESVVGKNPLIRLEIPYLFDNQQASLPAHVAILQNGKEIYGEVIYQFPDKSEFYPLAPVAHSEETTLSATQQITEQLQLDAISTRLHIKSAVIRKILQRPVDSATIAILIAALQPQAPTVPTLIDSINLMSLKQRESLAKLVHDIVSDSILIRSDQRLLNEILDQHAADFNQHQRASNQQFIDQQANRILKILFTRALNGSLIPLRISLSKDGTYWQTNRNFTRQDLGRMVQVTTKKGKTVFARIERDERDAGFPDDRARFELKISGVNEDTFKELHDSTLRIKRVRSDFIDPDHLAPTEGADYIRMRKSNVAGAKIVTQEETFTFELTESRSIQIEVASISDHEKNPLVRLKMPTLSADEKKGLQRNILVMHNGEESYGRAIYQFPDGSELSFWDPLPPVNPEQSLEAEIKSRLDLTHWMIKSQVPSIVQQIQKTLQDPATLLGKLLPNADRTQQLRVQQLINVKQLPPKITQPLLAKIYHLMQNIIAPLIDTGSLERKVEQKALQVKASYSPEESARFIQQQATQFIDGLLTYPFNFSLSPLQITIKETHWQVNRNFSLNDIGTMVAVPLPNEKTVFARIDFNSQTQRFILRISGIPNWDDFSAMITKFRPPFGEEYRIEMREGVSTKEIKTVGDTFTLFDGTQAQVVSISKGKNPFVTLKVPKLKAALEDTGALQRNISIDINGRKDYGRVIYQFSDGSQLSFWGKDQQPVVETMASLTKQLQIEANAVLTRFRAALWSKIIEVIRPSDFQQSTHVAVNMLAGMLPLDMPASILANSRSLTDFFPEETISLKKKINEIVKKIILPRLKTELLTRTLNDYFLDNNTTQAAPPEQVFIDQEVVKIVRKLFTNAMNEPLAPLQIKLKEGVLQANRHFSQEDIGRMVELPRVDGNNQFAQIIYKNDTFSLKVSGVASIVDAQPQGNIAIKVPFIKASYPVLMEETRQSAVIAQEGQALMIGINRPNQDGVSVKAEVISIGSEENPVVQLRAYPQTESDKNALQRMITVQQNGKKISRRIHYLFADGTESPSWNSTEPVATASALTEQIKASLQLDAFLKSAHTHRLKLKILEQIANILQPSIDTASAVEKLTTLFPFNLQIVALQPLLHSGRVPTDLSEQLKSQIDTIFGEVIPLRLTQSTEEAFNNLVNQHEPDYAQYHSGQQEQLINQQAKVIIQQLLVAALSDAVPPLRIERQGEELTLNRRFTQQDVNKMITVPTATGKRAFARIASMPDGSFELVISGVDRNIEFPDSRISVPLLKDSYRINTRIGDIVGVVNQGAEFSIGLQNGLIIAARAISLGDENDPRVLMQIPNLSMDDRRSLQRNVLVIRNGVETYSGIRYQFTDGTEYSFPYPLTTEETPVPADSMTKPMEKQILESLNPVLQKLLTLSDSKDYSPVRRENVAGGTSVADNINLAGEQPVPHHFYAHEIAVIDPQDEEAMTAAGRWLREDPAHRDISDINYHRYSPNGNPMEGETTASARQALQQKIVPLLAEQQVRILFFGEKEAFSSPDTPQMISRFIDPLLTNGGNVTNLQVVLGKIIYGNTQSHTEVAIDYTAPLAVSADGAIQVQPLVLQPSVPRSKGLLGGNRAYADPLVDRADLATRLHRVIALMDALHTNALTFDTLDAQQRLDLADFFPDADGAVDERKIAPFITDARHFALWHDNVKQLLQLPDAHAQLAHLTGEQALVRSQESNRQQISAITAWKGVEAEHGSNVRLAPQALFIADASRHAQTAATATGLAWLDAQAQGGLASERYLNGLNTYATLNEQRAEAPLSDNDAKQVKQFRQLFDGLLATPDDHPTIFSQQPLPVTHAEMAPGQYLIKIDHQVLTLSVKNNGHFSLYHPNVGAMQITGADVGQNRQALESTLRAHINSSTEVTLYKVDLIAAREQFSGLKQLQTLLSDYKTEAQRLAAAPDVTLSAVPIPVAVLNKMGARIDGKPFSVDHLKRLSPLQLAEQLRFDGKKLARYLHQADYGSFEAQQAVRFLRQQIPTEGSMESLLIASDNAATKASVLAQLEAIRQQVTFKPQLAAQTETVGSQTPKLTLEIAPSLGDTLKSVPIAGSARLQHFTRRAGGTMQGYGYLRSLSDLTKYNRRLQNQSLTPEQREQLTQERDLALFALSSNMAIDLTQEGLGVWGSRLTQLGLRSGFKLQLARFGGPALGVLSSGFDLYQAFRAFSKLSTTTDPTMRQDLIVEGALSLTGALVSIGVPIAFAIGGTAAAVAGPVGLAFGAALLLAGGIYSAVREVEEIKKVIALDGWETFQAGVLAFTGQDQTYSLENRLAAYQVKAAAEKALTARLNKAAKTLLRANINIETLYLSRGEVTLKTRSYRRLVATDISGGDHILRDRIRSTETPSSEAEQQAAASYAARHSRGNTVLTFKQSEGKTAVRLQPYDLNYYLPQAGSVDEVVDLNDDANLPSTVLKKSFIGAEQSVGAFVATAAQPLPTTDLNPLQNDSRVMRIDINHDGHPDIAYYSKEGFDVVKSDGQGGYSDQRRIDSVVPLIWPTLRTMVGDINGDGWDDMVAVGDSSEPMQIFLAKQDGTFAHSEQSYGVRQSRLSDAPAVLLDVDKDGRADVVSFTRGLSSGDSQLGYVNIIYGKKVEADDTAAQATGIFEPLHSMALATLYGATSPASVAEYLHRLVGDIDGDGDDDIVSMTKTGMLYTLLSSGNRLAPFITKEAKEHEGIKKLFESGKFNNAQIQLHDMNGDQRADLVVIQDDGSYTIAEGQADGTFGTEKTESRQNRFALRGDAQIIGIIEENGEKCLLSVRPSGELIRAPFRRPSEAESINKVNMGGGNDTVLGKRDRKNDFDVGGGRKQFTGGSQADRFHLLGQAAPATPSILDGGNEVGSHLPDLNDTVIASRRPANGKSTLLAIDIGLAAYFREDQRQQVIDHLARIAPLSGQAREEAIAQLTALAQFQVLAQLKNIENAYGQTEVNVVLSGDEGNNTLGLGRGYAAGGKGTDTYNILRNQSVSANDKRP